MSEWLEHVREKYEQINDYSFYQGMKGCGIGVSLASTAMFTNIFIYSIMYGDAPSVLLPSLGLAAGFVIYGLGTITESPRLAQFKADMKQVQIERKKAELDKGKTAAIASLDEQIAAIEKSRVPNS